MHRTGSRYSRACGPSIIPLHALRFALPDLAVVVIVHTSMTPLVDPACIEPGRATHVLAVLAVPPIAHTVGSVSAVRRPRFAPGVDVTFVVLSAAGRDEVNGSTVDGCWLWAEWNERARC